jgi:hypothetical protein
VSLEITQLITGLMTPLKSVFTGVNTCDLKKPGAKRSKINRTFIFFMKKRLDLNIKSRQFLPRDF